VTRLRLFILLPVVIIVVISSFTLWLIEGPMKYFFFIFQVILTAAFVWLFVSPKLNVLKLVHKKHNASSFASLQLRHLDYLFLFISASLLLVNIFNVSTPLNVLLAFVVVSLLPGYVILRLTRVLNSISSLEAFILSYVLTVALSGILPALFTPFINLNSRVAFVGLIAFFSTLPILKDWLVKPPVSQGEKTFEFSSISFLTLSIVIGFFALIITSLYPQMTLLPGLDSIRNFSEARLFSLSPALFSSISSSLLIYESAMYSVSISSPEVYLTFLAFTSVTVLLSFYVMAKKYLDEIDNRLPFFATVFWAVFSGFGWIYLFENKLGQPGMTQTSLLSQAYSPTYADIRYGLSSNLWLSDGFIAMTVSFTIFFTLLYLLKCKNIPKISLMLLISVLVLALYFIHAPELFMFALFLVVLGLLGFRTSLRIDEALYSIFIAIVGAIALSHFLPVISPTVQTINILTIVVIGLVGPTCLFTLLKRKDADVRKYSKLIKMVAYALLIFFAVGLLSWPLFANTFSMNSVGNTFLVPWFFYPVRLGIIGLLGLAGICILADRHSKNALMIFPVLFFVAWIVGRVVSVVNLNLFNTGYFEWRFLFFSFAALCITSSVLLKHLQARALQKLTPKKSLGRICLCTLLISLLVLVGVSSTFLTIEQWAYSADQTYFDQNELNAISFLSSNLTSSQSPPPLLTVTSQSSSALGFVPSPWVVSYVQPIIWSSKSPEIPLTFLNNLRFSPPIIYLDQRDLNALNSTALQNSYLGGFLLQLIKQVYSNSEVKIYQLPSGVPPLQNGESVLVFDLNETTDNDLLASYLLSLGGYNYTTMSNSDPQISEHSTLIFPSDSIATADLTKLGLDNGQKIIILNSEGYGQLARLFFECRGNTATVNITSGGDVFVYDLVNKTLGLKSLSEPLFANELEFVMYNNMQGVNYSSIVGDNQTAFWSFTGGVGVGKISAPLLTNDPSMKIEGNDSLEAVINSGHYSDWYVQKNYPIAQDWSQREFMSVWWYGTNSGQNIGILAAGATWNNYFQYNFVDNFTGWQNLIIPLNEFTPHGTPNWDSISILQIRSFNGGTSGTLHLGPIGVEDGNNASTEITINNATATLPTLSVFNGPSYVPITLPKLNSSIEIPANNLYFTDGSRADSVFGVGYSGEVQMERINDTYVITVSVKLPPPESASSQIRFRVGYEGEMMNASSLVTNNTETSLPTPIALSPFIPTDGTSVLSSYATNSTNVPLIAKQIIGNQTELYYLNIYPIVSSVFANANSSQNLLKILANVLKIVGLPKYDTSVQSWVIDDANPVFAFKSASLQGNISINADSLIPSENLDLPEVYISSNNVPTLLKDVTSLSIQNIGGKIALSSHNVSLENGTGFYPFMVIDNPEIVITGQNISMSALTSNGTLVNSQSSTSIKLSINGSLSAYMRNPSIQTNGEAFFQETYAFHSYLTSLQTMGQDLNITGEISFNLPLSDQYSIASNFTWTGSAVRNPPAFTWDELGSIKESIPYFILAIVIFSVVWILAQLKYDVNSKRLKGSAKDLEQG
jgi:hypothetical protein